jgi:putative AdoMet-dependent methyltransferase
MEDKEVQFNHVFSEWASKYDSTVYSSQSEYREAFEGYDNILKEVVKEVGLPANSRVLEIGVGTGNLTRYLLEKNWDTYGVDPSPEMRAKAMEKIPHFIVDDGHFLKLPEALNNLGSIVSTYAFHHLTDEQKSKAVSLLTQRLAPDGKIVMADTAYKDEQAKSQLLNRVKEQGAWSLLKDLETEYYPMIDTIKAAFENAGLQFSARQLNRYVWLMAGVKQK